MHVHDTVCRRRRRLARGQPEDRDPALAVRSTPGSERADQLLAAAAHHLDLAVVRDGNRIRPPLHLHPEPAERSRRVWVTWWGDW